MDFIRFALEDKSAKAAKPVRYDRHRFEADACNANRRRINPPPDSPREGSNCIDSDSALCASIHFGTVVALKPHRPKKILLAGGSRSYPAMRA
jgi:hypothetical protein